MKFNKKIVIGTWPLSGDYGHLPAQQVSSILEYAFLKKFNEFDTHHHMEMVSWNL